MKFFLMATIENKTKRRRFLVALNYSGTIPNLIRLRFRTKSAGSKAFNLLLLKLRDLQSFASWRLALYELGEGGKAVGRKLLRMESVNQDSGRRALDKRQTRAEVSGSGSVSGE